MITKAEILSTWDSMAPHFAAAPEELPRFTSSALRGTSDAQQKMEMEANAVLIGLCAQLPGAFDIRESVEGGQEESQMITIYSKGGIEVGRIVRYNYNTPLQHFQTETVFELSQVGSALLDQHNPEHSEAARRIIDNAKAVF